MCLFRRLYAELDLGGQARKKLLPPGSFQLPPNALGYRRINPILAPCDILLFYLYVLLLAVSLDHVPE